MTLDQSLLKELKHRSARIRWLSVKSTSTAGSGHPTSCCSCADILATLFFNVMRYEASNPGSDRNDRLVMSKGHAAPALYASWCEAGFATEKDVMSLRKMGSRYEGHPMPSLPFVDVATGSLGQGLSVGLGIAIHQRKVLKSDARTFVLMGDGEMAEGSVWEAFALAGNMSMDNLTAIIDVNRLGQSCQTMHGHDLISYAKKVEAFGWEALVLEDGHDFEQLVTAFSRAENVKSKPVCIIAKTFKGHGMEGVSDLDNWHGKPVPQGEHLDKILSSISTDFMKVPPQPSIRKPGSRAIDRAGFSPIEISSIPGAPFKADSKTATRQAVGDALVALGKADKRIWVIDGDTQNSTYAQKFAQAFPERFVECYIAEQNMAGIAAGMAARGLIPFVCTFGAFLARAFDQVRMAALSGLPIKLIGTHAGVSIGEDGPSQMALEDLAAFRTLPNGAVFYPSDAVSAYACILQLAAHNGPGYIRLSRPASPILYSADEKFPPGGLKIINKAAAPKITVVSSGVVVHEVLDAIRKENLKDTVQVVDLYCVKPFPVKELRQAVAASNGVVAIFEEHSPEGGIGEASITAIAESVSKIAHIAVDKTPRSASPEQMLHSFGLSAEAIARKIRSML